MPGARFRRWTVSERFSVHTPASDAVKYTPFNPQELRIPRDSCERHAEKTGFSCQLSAGLSMSSRLIV